MITVKTDNKNLMLECDAGIAGDVLYTLSAYKPTYKGEGRVEICVSMDYINQINRDLAKYKGKLILDSSFIEWKEKYAGKTPVLIRCGVITSRIYKSPHYNIPHKELEDVMKFFFTPAVRQKAFKDKKWDGYIHLYKSRKHEFPTGLLDRAKSVFESKGIAYKIEYTYDAFPAKEFDWKAKELFNLTDDQKQCIEAALAAGRCTLRAATGFGKLTYLNIYKYVLAASYRNERLFNRAKSVKSTILKDNTEVN